MGSPKKEGHYGGRITKGIQSNTLRTRIIEFIYQQLAEWRDHPDLPAGTSEKQLNPALCKFLDVRARRELPAVYFQHEEPQASRHSVDLSALPVEKVMIETRSYSLFNPILVIECKRLPAPSVDREKEYVTGMETNKGGIQRFKLGLHGNEQDEAVMIGYIQKDKPDLHLQKINGWISSLAKGDLTDNCDWSKDKKLKNIDGNAVAGIFKYSSKHARVDGDFIVIYHLWVKMN